MVLNVAISSLILPDCLYKDSNSDEKIHRLRGRIKIALYAQ